MSAPISVIPTENISMPAGDWSLPVLWMRAVAMRGAVPEEEEEEEAAEEAEDMIEEVDSNTLHTHMSVCSATNSRKSSVW